MKEGKRFVKLYSESHWNGSPYIWLDTETGVHYLFIAAGYGGGLAPLLGADGKPVISSPEEIARLQYDNAR